MTTVLRTTYSLDWAGVVAILCSWVMGFGYGYLTALRHVVKRTRNRSG